MTKKYVLSSYPTLLARESPPSSCKFPLFLLAATRDPYIASPPLLPSCLFVKRKLKTWNYLTLHKNCRLLELKIFKIIVLFLQQPQYLKHSEFADKKFSDFAAPHVHGEVLKGTYLKLTQIALIKLIN